MYDSDERMTTNDHMDDEIVRRGRRLYEDHLRAHVGTGNEGKLLVINVDTGEYELDKDDAVACERAKARFPDAPLYTMRIGHPAAYRLGGRTLNATPE